MVLLVQVALVDFLEYQVIQVTAVLEFQGILGGVVIVADLGILDQVIQDIVV